MGNHCVINGPGRAYVRCHIRRAKPRRAPAARASRHVDDFADGPSMLDARWLSAAKPEPLHRRRPELPVPGVPRAAAADHDQGAADGRRSTASARCSCASSASSGRPTCASSTTPPARTSATRSSPSTRRTVRPCRPSWRRSWRWSRQVVEAFGLTQLEVPGFEADDIIATLARVAAAAGMEVVICSSDKDLMQLCDGDVSRARHHEEPAHRARPRCARSSASPPEQVGDVLALMGDSIDNVPGVAGIGPKTAAELINKFGSLDALLARRRRRDQGQAGRRHRRGARGGPRLARAGARCATTCRCRRRWPSCTGSIPIKQRLRGLFRELEFSRLAEQLAAVGRGGNRAARRGHAAPAAARRRAERRSRRAAAAAGRRHPRRARRSAALARRDRGGGRGRDGGARTTGRRRCAAIWSGSPSRCPGGRRVYLPLRHRYLGAPVCLPRGGRAGDARRRARRRPAVAKHAHDAKTLEVLLRRRGPGAGRRGRRTRCWRPTCSTPRARATTWTSSPRPRGSRRPRGAQQLDGHRRVSAARARDISVEEVGPRLGAEAAAALALADAAGGASSTAAGLDGALPRHGAAARARAGARSSAAASSSTSTGCARSATRSARSLVALETEIHALAGRAVQHQLATSSWPTSCSASCRCRWSAGPRPARRPTPTRWRSWPRCTRCRPRSSSTARSPS